MKFFKPIQSSNASHPPPIKFNCEACQVEVWETRSNYELTKHHFCSRKCYWAFKNSNYKKEEHPKFGTGVGPEERERRNKVRVLTNTAIKIGKLIRQPCEKCGDPASQAHHDDYDKPLEVRWLCFMHHRMEHGHKNFKRKDRSADYGLMYKSGENHPYAKFTNKDILKIREMIQGGVSNKEIAAIFNVDPTSISAIKTGKSWSHVI